MKNVAPSETCTPAMVPLSNDQLRIAGVSAATPSAAVRPAFAASHCWTRGDSADGIGANALRMYPAAIVQPSDSTGVHASQLHHTDSGAISLLYFSHAAAPYTDAPPDLFGNKPAISA